MEAHEIRSQIMSDPRYSWPGLLLHTQGSRAVAARLGRSWRALRVLPRGSGCVGPPESPLLLGGGPHQRGRGYRGLRHGYQQEPRMIHVRSPARSHLCLVSRSRGVTYASWSMQACRLHFTITTRKLAAPGGTASLPFACCSTDRATFRGTAS